MFMYLLINKSVNENTAMMMWAQIRKSKSKDWGNCSRVINVKVLCFP